MEFKDLMERIKDSQVQIDNFKQSLREPRFIVLTSNQARDKYDYEGPARKYVICDTEYNEWNLACDTRAEAEAIAKDFYETEVLDYTPRQVGSSLPSDNELQAVSGQGFSMIDRAHYRITGRMPAKSQAQLKLVKE